MLESVIFSAIVIIALLIIVLNKDNSILGFLMLILSCTILFLVGYYFDNVFLFVIFSLGVGFVVAYMGYDELVVGRKWLYSLVVLSLILSIVVFSPKNDGIEVFWLVSVALMGMLSIFLSYNKRFLKICKKRVNDKV